MNASLSEVLRRALREAAGALDVPLSLPGEPFFLPPGPFARATVALEETRAAALGRLAPSRTDGALELETAVPAASGAAAAEDVARRFARFFPRGKSLPVRDAGGLGARGHIVFGEPVAGAARCDGARLLATVRLPFYALLFPMEDASCS